MKIKFLIPGFIFILIFTHYSNAQKFDLKFNLVDGPNGKPLGKVNAITQDPHGYIWLCGSGERCIYRYDGNKMITFRHDDTNPNSLELNTLETIYADDKGMIWIGGEGLDQYNPETRVFTHYNLMQNDTASPDGNYVYSILKDHLDRLWVGTGNGLKQLDEKTGKFIFYHHEPGNPKSLSSNVIWRLYEDHEGVLWLATGYPFFNRNPEDGGLNRLNADGTFTSFMHDSKDPSSLSNNKIAAMYEDNHGTFWVGTGGDGLHIMDRKTGRFERHPYSPNHPDILSGPLLHSKDKNDKITFITGDNTGALWIGTMYSGINHYDAVTKKSTHFENSNGFPDSTSWNTFTSKEGVLWIMTQSDNLYRVDPFHASITNITTNSLVAKFLEDQDGLWVATRGKGLLKFDKDYHIIQQYQHNPSDSFSLTSDNISLLYQNEENSIWVGTDEGLQILNKSTHKFSKYWMKDKPIHFPEIHITNFLEDKEGILWISTWGNGFYKYNPKDNMIKQFVFNARDSSSISTNEVGGLMEGTQGTLWIGSSNGINRFDLKTEKFKHYLQTMWAVNLSQDPEGMIWVGTQSLFRYNPKDDRFSIFFDPQQELNSLIVGEMVEDSSKNLWFPSAAGIIKLNPITKETFIYGSKFGINPDGLVLWGMTIQNKEGQIFIPHNQGFYTFSPAELEIKTNFTINITDFLIHSNPIVTAKGGPITKSLEETDYIDLKYNQNNIAFNFAAIDYRAPESIKYAYMLEGYDNDWRKIEDKKEKNSSYFNLLPGHYVYRVKAFNADGSKAEKAIRIHIYPPWWQTWWAYTSYILFAVFSIWAFIRWRTRTLEKEKTILEEKVMERTIELKKEKETVERTLTELKSTQAQLIQSEKMASLGELTAGIAHEIQNPLNFVNNFSEINNELINELKQEAYSGNLGEVQMIAENIKSNSEKINHHGLRASSIVKNMLEHSRTSTGIKELTDINTLCEEYLKLSYQAMRAKDPIFQSDYKLELDPNLPKIKVIPQDISRVLLNLINNAFYTCSERSHSAVGVRKSEDYKPLVTVSTKKFENQIEIKISDNGFGIPDSIKDKIFQPFYTTKPAGQGTGLGLSLSYDIIKAHSGSISVNTYYREPGLKNAILNYREPGEISAGHFGKVETNEKEGVPDSNRDGQEGTTFVIQLPL